MNKKLVVSFLGCLTIGASVEAIDSGFDAISFRPTNDRSPYLGVWGSDTLGQSDYNLSMTTTYANQPVNVENAAGVETEFVRAQYLAHMAGSIGIYRSFINLGFEAPMGLVQARSSSTGSMGNKVAVGDLRFDLKMKIVDARRYGVGLAFIPFFTVPTGYGKQLMGNSSVTGGGLVAFDGSPLPGFSLSSNLGMRLRKSYTINDQSKSHELLASAGMSTYLFKYLSFVGEISSRTRLAAPYSSTKTTGVEGLGAFRVDVPGTGVSLMAGGGGGIVRGLETPKYRTIFGIAFHSADSKVWD